MRLKQRCVQPLNWTQGLERKATDTRCEYLPPKGKYKGSRKVSLNEKP